MPALRDASVMLGRAASIDDRDREDDIGSWVEQFEGAIRKGIEEGLAGTEILASEVVAS